MKRFLIGIIALFLATACSPYTTAYRVTYATMGATQLTGDTMGQVERPKHTECLKHGANTKAYADCISPTSKRLEAWRRYARPTARTSIAATLGGIRIAEKGGQSNWDWLAVLKVTGCAIIPVVQQWEAELPDKTKGIYNLLKGLGTLACKQKDMISKSGIASTIFNVGVGVMRVAVDIFGVTDDELVKEIEKWLNSPAKDATDKLADDIANSMPK